MVAAALLLVGAGFFPVRQSVLAPAEIVPRAPAVIRAPFEGVVDSVLAGPNEASDAGARSVCARSAPLTQPA